MPALPRSIVRWRALLAVLAVLASLNVAAALGSLALATIDERAHPPIGEFVTVEGRRLHFVRTSPPMPAPGTGADAAHGERAAVRTTDRLVTVLLHGGGTSLLDMHTSLSPALLMRGHAVIAFDRPGHGYSDAWPGDASPDRQARLIRGALAALEVERSVWVGHSRGAPVVLAALLVGAGAPGIDPVAGVLIAGVTQPAAGPPPPHVSILQGDTLGPWFAWSAIEYAGRLAMPAVIETAFAPEAVPARYIERTALDLSLRPRQARQDALERAAVDDWLEGATSRYTRIGTPLLAVQGADDAVVPGERHLQPLRERVPVLATRVLPGAGHGLLHTRTATVADAIDAWMDALPR